VLPNVNVSRATGNQNEGAIAIDPLRLFAVSNIASGNDVTKSIFEQWIAPIKDLEITTVTGATAAATKEPGGTDHTTFLWVGLPGFGFMQDPLEYGTRTHHSNMDLYDRVQAGDVMQGAAIEAWFVYNTATRPEMLPRIDTPEPLQGK